jgi:hypothetical protein
MRHRIFIILLSVLLAACSTPEVTEETPFRSDQFHLEVTLPPGWAGAEGPEYLARPFTGLVAFNSWGEGGFWAPEVTTATSATYSPRSILGQIPDGGAYVVLVHFSGGPHLPAEQYGPEHERQDLSGLEEIVARITQAEVQGETVVVTLTYRWDEPLLGPGSDSDDCPPDRCHWWRFEARPSGEVVLVEEGGAVLLPGGTQDKVR